MIVIINSVLSSDGQTGNQTPTIGNIDDGYGLTAIRERLLLINGTLTISADDHTWTVMAQVPR